MTNSYTLSSILPSPSREVTLNLRIHIPEHLVKFRLSSEHWVWKSVVIDPLLIVPLLIAWQCSWLTVYRHWLLQTEVASRSPVKYIR
jgi:hypothetical protein